MAATVGNLRVELSVGTKRALQNLRTFQANLRTSTKGLQTVSDGAAAAGRRIAGGMRQASDAVARYRKQVSGLRGLKNLTADPTAGRSRISGALSGAMGRTQEVKGQLESVAMSAAKVTAALTVMGGVATVTFAKFESSLTRAAAIASGGGAQFAKAFDDMGAAAIQQAARSQFSANEVAQGMGFMAMAGNDATATIAAMPAAIQLASAAQQDLATATDTVTNIMAGFQIRADAMGSTAQKLADANNVLVGAFTNSNVSLGELGEAMKIAGPVASSLSVGIVDTAAALGVLGNAGIKGTLAGTGLKRIFTSLAKDAAPKAKKALDLLGVSMQTLEEKGIAGVVDQLEVAKEALGDQAFTGAVFTAFGERAGPQLAALVGQGAKAITDLQKKIEAARKSNIAGVLEERQMATLSGQFAVLKSNAEAMAISFGQALVPAVKPFTKILQSIFKALTDLNPSTKKWITLIGMSVAVFSGVVAAMATFAAGLVAIKVATIAATTASLGLSGAIMGTLGPAIAVLGAVFAGLTLGLVIAEMGTAKDLAGELASAFSWAAESTTNLKTTFRNLGIAIASIPAALADLIGLGADVTSFFTDWAGAASDAADAMDKLSPTETKISNLTDEIRELQKELRDAGVKEVGNLAKGLASVKVRRFDVDIKKMLQRGFTTSEIDALNEKAQLVIDKAVELKDTLKQDRAIRKGIIRESQKEANLAKKKAAEEKKAADEEAKRRAARIKAIQKAAAAQAKADAASQRALDRIRDIREGAAIRVDIQEAGDLGQIVSNMADFQKEIDDLTDAFKQLNMPKNLLDDVTAASDDLRTILIGQARTFLEGKEGTQDFANVVQKVVELINAQLPNLKITEKDIAPPPDTKQEFTDLDNAMKGLAERMHDAREAAAQWSSAAELSASMFPDITQIGQDLRNNLAGINDTFGEGATAAKEAIAAARRAAEEAGARAAHFMNRGASEEAPEVRKAMAERARALSELAKAEAELSAVTDMRATTEKNAHAIAVDAMADELNGIRNFDRFQAAMAFARETASKLGIKFDQVEDQVKVPGFDDVERTQGISLGEMFAGAVDKMLQKAIGHAGNRAAASDAIGAGLSDLFTTGSIDLGSTLGTAVGAAFGQPQIGAAIGQAIEGSILSVASALKEKLDSLIALIPDERLSAATQTGTDVAISTLLGTLGGMLLAGLGSVLALVAASIATPLAVFAVLFAPVLAVIALLASPLIILIGIIGAIVTALTAFLVIVAAIPAALAGLTMFFMQLATQTESFERLQNAFGVLTDQIIGVIDPLVAPFLSLAGLFSAFIPILTAFLPSVEFMTQAARVVFEIFKFGALTLGAFFMVVAQVQNALIGFAQMLFGGDEAQEGIRGALTALADVLLMGAGFLLDAFGIIAALLPAEAQASLAEARAAVSSVDTSAFGDAGAGLIDELDGLRANTGWIADAMGQIAGMTFEAALEQGNALAEMADSQESLNSTLTNAPEGFKESLARFNAMRANEIANNTGAGTSPDGTPAGGLVTNIGTIVIEVQDDQEAVDRLQEMFDDGFLNVGGTIAFAGKQFNPGHG